MADKKIKRPKNISSAEWKELLHVLDELEHRPHKDEVEEVVAGHPKARRNINPPAEGGTTGNVNDPFSLLVVPGEGEADQEENNQLASLLFSNLSGDEGSEDLPTAAVVMRNPFRVLAALLIPRREDSLKAIGIKSGILLSIVAVLVCFVMLVNNLFWIPYSNRQLNHELFALYDAGNDKTVTDSAQYPVDMLAAFKGLYDRNRDIQGWLSFHSSGESDMINVEYPVVQTDNNKTYISTDFDKNKNKNGTLFFDEKCLIQSAVDTSQVLVLYGNSTGNGQMLSNLSKLIGNVNNARLAPTFTLSTLYEKADYYVMAVVLLDGKEKELDYKRTTFENDEEFLNHVQAFRDRSLFDYPTDLFPGDQLAVIGTTVSSSVSNLSDGRLLILGRRQRYGESGIELSEIVKNEDVIMPYRWYTSQKITPHDYYYQGSSNRTTTTTESTTTTDSTTATTTFGTVMVTDTNGSVIGTETVTWATQTVKTELVTDIDGAVIGTRTVTEDDGSTTVNKNTYTTSHTYTETTTSTTTRSVPTGIVITKVPQSTGETTSSESNPSESASTDGTTAESAPSESGSSDTVTESTTTTTNE